MSLRKSAPSGARSTLASGAPVRRSNPRTASRSVTQSVSPAIAMPLGACSVTRPAPPAMNRRFSTRRSVATRLMNPLSSFACHAVDVADEPDLLLRIPARADSGRARPSRWRRSPAPSRRARRRRPILVVGHSPDPVGRVVGHQQRAVRPDRDAERPAVDLGALGRVREKPPRNSSAGPDGPAVGERDEEHAIAREAATGSTSRRWPTNAPFCDSAPETRRPDRTRAPATRCAHRGRSPARPPGRRGRGACRSAADPRAGRSRRRASRRTRRRARW